MKNKRKDLIETIRLVISTVTVSITVLRLVKRFIDWSGDSNKDND